MPPTASPDDGPRARHEDGVGVVSSIFGVMAFLGFVLLVVQVVLHMFTASIVQTAALDGATAGSRADVAVPVEVARDRARAVLGGLASEATVHGAVAPTADGSAVLRVTVTVSTPSGLVRGIGLRTIERSAEVRIER